MEKSKKSGERVQVLSKITNRDLTASRNEYLFRTPFLVDAMLPLLNDKRDEPMLCLQLNILQVIIPGLSCVYGLHVYEPPFPTLTRNLAGLAYIVIVCVLFLERFILCLHFSSHRSMYKVGALNHALVWYMAPFFGIPSGVYKLHHVIMHHIENNSGMDISETECFQRDSWSHFGYYWLRFVALIWVDLPFYVIRTRRWAQAAELFAGLAFWVSFQVLLSSYVSAGATFWCFNLPYVIGMSAMSFGNWSQHIFVNPEDAASNYALTYNCINSPTNQTTFNDGYHVIHHANARLHWTEIPQYFYKPEVQERHIKGGALTFSGIHFFDVGILVMTKRLNDLARYYVHLGPEESAPTIDEVVVKLGKWLTPAPVRKPSATKLD